MVPPLSVPLVVRVSTTLVNVGAYLWWMIECRDGWIPKFPSGMESSVELLENLSLFRYMGIVIFNPPFRARLGVKSAQKQRRPKVTRVT